MKKNYFFLCFLFLLSITVFAQPEIVAEINNDGTSSSSPNNLFVFNGTLFFGADDSSGNTAGGDFGRELWSSDGTSVSFIRDLNAGTSNSSPGSFFEYNGTLYFSANPGSGSILYTTDGTFAGTSTTGDPGVFFPQQLDGVVYFNNTVEGNKLWQFTGADSAEAVAGSGDESISGANFFPFGTKLLIYMGTETDDPTIGRELYEYDPATDTFTLILDIAVGDANSGISNFVALDGEVYFEATGKVWKTDGTGGGTAAIAAASSINSTNNYYSWNGKLFFEGDDGNGDQLWVYDPTMDTVTNISNLSGTNTNHDPSDYAEYDGFLYYRGEDSNDTDGHLWRTDGTTTEQLDDTIKDIDEITVLNGVLYFEGDNDTTGNELYKLDPTTLSIDIISLSELKIYPNPSQNQINISGDFTKIKNFIVADLNGRTVLSGKLSSNVINHDLASGMYLLTLKNDTSSIIKKIVID